MDDSVGVQLLQGNCKLVESSQGPSNGHLAVSLEMIADISGRKIEDDVDNRRKRGIRIETPVCDERNNPRQPKIPAVPQDIALQVECRR
jgi:hypothetical protein